MRHLVTGLLALSIALAGCGSSNPEGADQSAELEQNAPTDGGGIAPASATSDDTFDATFYDPDEDATFPALDDPDTVSATSATWLAPDDIVMGIVSDSGESMAFPVDQMAYHHVANTRLAGEPFVVTY